MNATEWRRAVFPGHVILQPFVIERMHDKVVMSYLRWCVVSYSIFAAVMITIPTACISSVPYYLLPKNFQIAKILIIAFVGISSVCIGLFVFLPLPFLPFMKTPKVVCSADRITLDFGFRRSTHDRVVEIVDGYLIIERVVDENAPIDERSFVSVHAGNGKERYLLECQFEPTNIVDRWKECEQIVRIEYRGFHGKETLLPNGTLVLTENSFQNTSTSSFAPKTLKSLPDGSLSVVNSLEMCCFGLMFFLAPSLTIVAGVVSDILDVHILTLEHMVAWIIALPIFVSLSWAGLSLLLCRAGNPNFFIDKAHEQLILWHWGYDLQKVAKVYTFRDCYAIQILSARRENGFNNWEVNVIVSRTGDRISIFKYSRIEDAINLANMLSSIIGSPIIGR
ncbi:hypothetical protein K2Y11_20405 [bacterium]|nr:hypothetical protein [bacterium]